MLREEAINLIDINRSNLKATNEEGFSKDIEALDRAIKALEQEPCEDCISRQAVEKITWEEPSYADALNVLTEVRDKVRALPSVNPQEPKTGHWIYDRRRDWDGECKYECSECGMGSDVDYAYCMRCGAKMVEPQESEEKE